MPHGKSPLGALTHCVGATLYLSVLTHPGSFLWCQACVHLYSTDEPPMAADEVAAKIAAAASKRFGSGKVGVSNRSFAVDASLKAYDLDALRAFD